MLTLFAELDNASRTPVPTEVSFYNSSGKTDLIERCLGQVFLLSVKNLRYDFRSVLDSHISLVELVDEGRRFVIRYAGPSAQARFLSVLDQLERALQYGPLQYTWPSVAQSFDGNALTRLGDMAAALEDFAEQHVGDETYQTLLADLHTFLDNLRNSDLDPELLNLLIQHAETLLKALQSYRVRGSAAVDEAITVLVGLTARHHNLIGSQRDNSQVKRLYELIADLTR